MKLNRRNFLLGSAAASAVMASGCATAKKGTRVLKPGEKPTLAMIGFGIQARGLLAQFLGQPIVVVGICDVDKTRREDGVKRVETYYKEHADLGIKPGACKAYSDFREVIANPGIDMVCVATPDHWHAYISIEAMKAGKDVYCEKPLTYSVEEAVMVMNAEKKYGRVLQTGAMQRSAFEFRTACELVRNGAIGKVRFVDCNYGRDVGSSALLGGPSQPHRFFSDIAKAAEEGALNPDVDWNMWLGGAPWSPYSDKCAPRGVHNFYPMFWRFDDYFGTGYCGDWGAHHLDIAQWGLDMDESGPVKIIRSDAPHSTNPIHGCRRQIGMKFVFADGTVLEHAPFSLWGTVFYGDDGIVAVNRGCFSMWRGALKGAPTAEIRKALEKGALPGYEIVGSFHRRTDGSKDAGQPEWCNRSLLEACGKASKAYDLKNAKVKLYKSTNHPQDYVQRFHDRKPACSRAEVGARSAILCQLCNMSYMYDTGFDWDPARLDFANGTGDKSWLRRPYYRNNWRPCV